MTQTGREHARTDKRFFPNMMLLFLCHSRPQMILYLQGLLALEGELTPILVQMVKSANMNGLLDSDSDSLSSCQQRVKARLHEILQKDRDFSTEDYEKVLFELFS